jgi:hypothetical protein
MALGLTKHLTEMSTRNLPGGKGMPALRLTTSPQSVSRFSRTCGSLDVSRHYWPSRPVTGVALFVVILATKALISQWKDGHRILFKILIFS